MSSAEGSIHLHAHPHCIVYKYTQLHVQCTVHAIVLMPLDSNVIEDMHVYKLYILASKLVLFVTLHSCPGITQSPIIYEQLIQNMLKLNMNCYYLNCCLAIEFYQITEPLRDEISKLVQEKLTRRM